ncbi:MAG: hypothetical protein A3A86_01020 [Elusimicrobia bacterium RIFCSPLOWO2_01_FULL_60_11]|nr:MAG: hypothetical protein A3A86_01020 [Elusimicrobia bacterium RIFCSPLOWO2_01_FULL_60_11]
MKIDEFSLGLILGILISDGHFGGDGKQAHITLRMHVRHARLLSWLLHLVPGSKLYGPYKHDGRNYLQWMARGEALRELAALLKKTTFEYLDPYSHERFVKMIEDYRLKC